MKELGKLKLSSEKTLRQEELLKFRGGSDCTGMGTNKCNADCPCTDPHDYCVDNKCTRRPAP